jgi:hypothetical protein
MGARKTETACLKCGKVRVVCLRRVKGVEPSMLCGSCAHFKGGKAPLKKVDVFCPKCRQWRIVTKNPKMKGSTEYSCDKCRLDARRTGKSRRTKEVTCPICNQKRVVTKQVGNKNRDIYPCLACCRANKSEYGRGGKITCPVCGEDRIVKNRVGKPREGAIGRCKKCRDKQNRPSEEVRIKAHEGFKRWSSTEQGKAFLRETGKRVVAKYGRPPSNGYRTPRGPANPCWKGGADTEIMAARRSTELQQWRKAVFERDNYTCYICKSRGGVYLNAHHIKSFRNHVELRFDVSNGMTLCRKCHVPIVHKGRNLSNPLSLEEIDKIAAEFASGKAPIFDNECQYSTPISDNLSAG